MRLVALCVMLASSAAADSWAPPQSRSWNSNDVGFVVEVFAPNSRHNTQQRGTVAYAYSIKRRAPRLEAKLVWQGPLVNPRAPVAALVTNDGYFITLDEWSGMGYGNAVVLYSPAGKVLRSYHLDNLAIPDTYKNVNVSVSSRDWRQHATYFHHAKRRQFQILLGGGILEFSLVDGSHKWVPLGMDPPDLGDPMTFHDRALDLATLTDLPP